MRFDLTRYWYQPTLNFLTYLLLPFSYLFRGLIYCRRVLYKKGMLSTKRFHVPVVVVGNLTVGGTGKTPFVIWLVQLLKSLGYRPGIVSRGMGGKKHFKSYLVKPNSSPQEVGDEAILLMRQTDCPMVVGINRAAAVNELLTNFSCDIVISDDGLQHYRLHRNLEIILVDGERRFGNAQLLPAGPLREPFTRLKEADFVVVTNGIETEWNMLIEPLEFVSVTNPNRYFKLNEFPYKKVHAVAAIGHPERFYKSLKELGLTLITHTFNDHHLFQANDFSDCQDLPIVMTEKDAVKCQTFADDRYWYLKINVKVSQPFQQLLIAQLEKLKC